MNIPAINNRPLEFRFWHTGQQTMYRVFDVTYNDVNTYLEDENGQFIGQFLFGIQDGILSQYTGVNDQHGNRIWEGDILLNECACEWGKHDELPVNFFTTVIFRFGMFGHVSPPNVYGPNEVFDPLIDPHSYDTNPTTTQARFLDVVGNIHQNANLYRMGLFAPFTPSSHLTVLTHGNRHF